MFNGKKLAYQRKLKGWNQEQLAQKLNISPSILITGFIGGVLGLILLGVLCSIPSLESPITVLFPIIFLSLLIASVITLSIGLENRKKDNENNFIFKLSAVNTLFPYYIWE